MKVTQEQQNEIRQLLNEGRKIEAIKVIRQAFGVSLRQAKQLADQLENELDDDRLERTQEMVDNLKQGGSMITGCLGGVFGFFGICMIGGAVWIGIINQQLVTNGVLVTATVVSDPYQPVFEYELYGQKYEHYSSTYSDPPSYELGEKVEMYVNPTDAEDVMVNTFSDRWLGITILGIMGLLFAGAGLLVGFVIRGKLSQK